MPTDDHKRSLPHSNIKKIPKISAKCFQNWISKARLISHTAVQILPKAYVCIPKNFATKRLDGPNMLDSISRRTEK